MNDLMYYHVRTGLDLFQDWYFSLDYYFKTDRSIKSK